MRLAPIVCTLLALAGCATAPIGRSDSVQVVEASTLPAPTRADFSPGQRPYYLGPYDKISIDVFGMPELQRSIQVDASGRIAFPLTGVVEVSGLTPFELGELLEQRLRQSYVRDPVVTVNLEDPQSQVVTVSGQVRQPGLYPVVGKMTLIRAVARAGGPGELAKLSDVVVFRTVNGQQYAGLFNLAAIQRGNYQDPEIYASDIVIVGESKARQLFQDALGATSLLSPLIILTRQ